MPMLDDAGAAAYRERLEAIGFKRDDWPWEIVPACPLCGGPPRQMLAQYDRYGHEVWFVKCQACPMAWLMRRLTEAGYARYYSEGWYRRFVAAVTGAPPEDELKGVIENQRWYQHGFLRFIATCQPPLVWPTTWPTPKALLDVGGSAGFVGRAIADRLFGQHSTVVLVDPAAWECQAERVHHFSSLADACAALPDLRYALVFVSQTIDHISDPVSMLVSCVDLIAPRGYLWVDMLDTVREFEHVPDTLTRTQRWQSVAKLDHPMYFDVKSSCDLLHRVGLVPLRAVSTDGRHLGFLCQRKQDAT